MNLNRPHERTSISKTIDKVNQITYLNKIMQSSGVKQEVTPLLFNIDLRELPEPPTGINLISYDDCITTILTIDIPSLGHTINRYLFMLQLQAH